MRAYVCDACEETYKPYVAKVDDPEISLDANGMTLVKIDRAGKIHGKGRMELCPKCMERVYDFVFNSLTTDESPYIKRLKYYKIKMDKLGANNGNDDATD